MKIKPTDIPNDTVTYSKLQNIAANNVVLGNIAGAGKPVAELTGSQVASLVSSDLLIDEDDMASDLDTKAPTQQSVKAYVDGEIAAIPDADVVLIDTQVASNSAEVVFTGLSSTYHTYEIRFSGVYPSIDSRTFAMRTSSNNGSSYDSGASDYTQVNFGAFPTSSGTGAANENYMRLVGNSAGNAANELIHGVTVLFNPSATTYTHTRTNYTQINNAGALYVGMVAAYRSSAAAVNAIQFSMLSANIYGTFKLYGYK